MKRQTTSDFLSDFREIRRNIRRQARLEVLSHAVIAVGCIWGFSEIILGLMR